MDYDSIIHHIGMSAPSEEENDAHANFSMVV